MLAGETAVYFHPKISIETCYWIRVRRTRTTRFQRTRSRIVLEYTVQSSWTLDSTLEFYLTLDHQDILWNSRSRMPPDSRALDLEFHQTWEPRVQNSNRLWNSGNVSRILGSCRAQLCVSSVSVIAYDLHWWAPQLCVCNVSIKA